MDKTMQLTKDLLFFCYDLSLQRKLRANGVRFITTAVSNDNKRFSGFIFALRK